MSTSSRRALVVAASIGVAVVVSAAGACTTFDGLTAKSDGSDAASDHDAVVVDAGDDSAAVTSYLSAGEAAKACAEAFKCPLLAPSILTSIAVPVDPTNYALCMDWLAGPLPPNRVGVAVQAGIFRCIASASTCADAAKCLPIEDFMPNDPRCADAGGDAGKERCIDDGGTVLRCGGSYALHCGSAFYAAGSSCLKGADNSHWCATSTNCTAQSSCIGALLDYCGAGSNLHESINCAASGYTCALNPEAGTPDCLTATSIEMCNAAGAGCEAQNVAVCDGYQKSLFDCAAMGATCSTKAGSARCVRAGDACSPFDATMNMCTGSRISLCTAGKASTFDCASVGLACVPGVGAQSGHCG